MFLQEKMHAHPSTLSSWLLCCGMASSHITSWQVEGKKMRTVADFIFLGSKIAEDCDCSHKVKWRLLLGRKAMTNLDSIFKSRDITLPTKGTYSQSCGFSSSHVRMWELDHKRGWVLKNWCFWTVVLEKTLESLGQQGHQASQSQRRSTLNIHWQNWCWSCSTLDICCKEPTHWKRPWCWERLRQEQKGATEWDGWMASSTQWTWVWANSGCWWGTGRPGVLQSFGSQRVGHN